MDMNLSELQALVMNKEAWRAVIHGVAKSRTRLSNWTKVNWTEGCKLSPCLFNLHTKYIMRNTGLEEAQAGIKTVGRNINNLRYAEDTILMAESEEDLKSLLMKVKEESEKVGL